MASIALPTPAETPVPAAQASLRQPPRIDALDWPCWKAPSILAAWDALVSEAVEPNPFLESWFLLASLRALDPGETVQILKFTADGRLCGLLPVKHEKDYYGKPIRLLANWIHPNCFLAAPLVANGMEEPFWRALFDWADGRGCHGLFLHLSGIPLGGKLDQALHRVLAEQGRLVGLVHREERALLASEATPEAYFTTSLSSKKRKELRRQLSRLSELGELRFERSEKPQRPPLTPAEMVRQIGTAGSWAVLQHIGQDPEYAALLDQLLDTIVPEVEGKTGPMLNRVGFIFVTSPGGVTPCHFDPEHNILLQIRGNKVLTQFPVTDTAYAADEAHEAYHTGGPREVPWNARLESEGLKMEIGPGEGLFVPVMAPHYVRTGPESSISLSITWRSQWSYEEADARAFNSVLRRAGLKPVAPGRWPRRNRAKALGWRVLRRLRG